VLSARLLVCFVLVAAHAQATKLAESSWLRDPAHGRSYGGAFSSVADDASAGYWNPAGLCRWRRPGDAYVLPALGQLDRSQLLQPVTSLEP